MKYYVCILSLILVVSCKKEEENSISLTKEFIENIYVSESYDIKDINAYMTKEYIDTYNSLSQKDKKIHEQYITTLIDEIRSILKENDFEYKVLQKGDLKEEESLNTNFSNSEGEELILKSKERLLFSFIIRNKKIHSFCPDIYLSTKDRKVPYFFFKRT